MRSHKELGAAVVAAALLAACGGSGSDAASERAATSTSTPTGTGDNGSGGQPGGAAGSQSGAPGAQNGQVGGTPGGPGGVAGGPGAKQGSAEPTETRPPTPLQATLAESCIAGGGRQTITITAPPESAAGYDSVYSDGRSGAEREGYYGGNKGTIMPASGSWTDTWVVASAAPSGQVQVNVQAIFTGYDVAQMTLTFLVVPAGSSCP